MGLIPLLSASWAEWSCLAESLTGSLTLMPNSPCSRVVPEVEPPVWIGIRPLWALRYFVLLGVRLVLVLICCWKLRVLLVDAGDEEDGEEEEDGERVYAKRREAGAEERQEEEEGEQTAADLWSRGVRMLRSSMAWDVWCTRTRGCCARVFNTMVGWQGRSSLHPLGTEKRRRVIEDRGGCSEVRYGDWDSSNRASKERKQAEWHGERRDVRMPASSSPFPSSPLRLLLPLSHPRVASDGPGNLPAACCVPCPGRSLLGCQSGQVDGQPSSYAA